MHTNHRRKNKHNAGKPRWYTALSPYKQAYWARERARQRHLLSHGRYDDLQVKHPDSVLWDAL